MQFKLWMLILVITVFFTFSCLFLGIFIRQDIQDPFQNSTHQVQLEWIADVLYKFREQYPDESKYEVIRIGKLRLTFRKSLPWKLVTIGGFLYCFTLFLAFLYFAIWRQHIRYNRRKTIRTLARQNNFKMCPRL